MASLSPSENRKAARIMAYSKKLVVIGSGPAAYTAAIYAARANLEPLVFGGVALGGQLMITSDVENYPGFAEPVAGPDLMEQMRKQCERLGVILIPEYVSKADLSRPPFQVETTEGTAASAQALIIATGAKAKLLGIESESRLMGHGVSACATCDGFFFKGKEIAVVGGGDTAVEEATFLTKFATKVTLIHRRDSLRASAVMAERAKRNPKIAYIWDSVVEEVLGRDSVTGLKLRNVRTKAVSDLACQGLFVAIGHTPTTGFLAGQLKIDENGYVATDGRTRTSVAGVFAAGDVMDSRYRQAVTAAGTGCMAALEAERYLAHHE
jgi:thioredoxin reductase (NADPH)